MVIVDVQLVSETGTGTSASSRTYERVFEVVFSGPYSAAELLLTTDAELPHFTVGEPAPAHPGDADALLKSVKPELYEDAVATPPSGETSLARYTVTYSTAEEEEDEEEDEDPRLAPPQISGGGSDLTAVPTKDRDGNPLLNSAGDQLTDIPEYPIRGAQITITRQETTNPATRAATYSNTVNDATWYGVDAGNALMGVITFTPKTATYNGATINWWETSYPLRFRRDGWQGKFIDCGYRRLNSAGDKLNTVTDEVGNTPSVPVLLDGEGQPLPPGEEPVIFPEEGYPVLEATNFGTLSLPNPFS